MPTYEYICNACEHEFERFQSITEAPVRTCPKCGKRSAKRRIGSGAGILFRGSGFYETDYRTDDYRKKAKSETDAASNGTEKPAAPAEKKEGAGAEAAVKPAAADPPPSPATPKRRRK